MSATESAAPFGNDRLDAQSRAEIAELFALSTLEAGAGIMNVYGRTSQVRRKEDESPVCEADEHAEDIILRGLQRRLPGIPVISEEATARGGDLRAFDRFVLVDPLDGTKEFLSRNGEFTVNIALIEGGAPVAGAVYAPAIGRLWYSGAAAFACPASPGASALPVAQAAPIRTRPAPAEGLVALASRSHGDPGTEAFLGRLPISSRRNAGSSVKFCLVAQGEADIYPRFATTMEWDTAAGDAVLRAAGGAVTGLDGRPMRYGKTENGFRNGSFVAMGDPGYRWPFD